MRFLTITTTLVLPFAYLQFQGLALVPSLILFSGIVLSVTIAAYIYKRNYYFEFTPDYILLRTSVLATQEKHIPYTAVQDVTVSQNIIDRMLGISSVVIVNAASTTVQIGNRPQRVGDSIEIPGQLPARAVELVEKIKNILSKIPSRENGL
ncbi:MAG: PH domain-containing protein [Ignavibacteriaceae bacterium]|jgi:membrane protein YdbS with pleckstrin-like domain